MYSFLLKQIVVTYSVQPRADQAYGLASNLRIQAHCVRPLSPVRPASYEEKASPARVEAVDNNRASSLCNNGKESLRVISTIKKYDRDSFLHLSMASISVSWSFFSGDEWRFARLV